MILLNLLGVPKATLTLKNTFGLDGRHVMQVALVVHAHPLPLVTVTIRRRLFRLLALPGLNLCPTTHDPVMVYKHGWAGL